MWWPLSVTALTTPGNAHQPVGGVCLCMLWCVWLSPRMAYQVISAVDWESDGTEGSVSIPVLASVTVDEGEFPCPTGQCGHALVLHLRGPQRG